MNIPFRRKVLYSTVVLIAGLLLCEAALRVRAMIRYGNPVVSVRDSMTTYDPALDLFVGTPGYEVRSEKMNVRINSAGFRGDEIAREKPANTIRIAVLGASTTFNAEVSGNHATWPHRLQEKLRSAHRDVNVEVINASLGGYVAADNLKNLRHRVLPFQPDLVVYYEANNEIVQDTRELALSKGLIDSRGRSPIITTLSTYSMMFNLAYLNLTILVQGAWAAKGKLDNVPADLPRHFVGVIDQMRAELAGPDVPLMLSTFIVKYRRNQDRATQIANADVAFYYMPWMSIDGLLSAMDVYNQALMDYGSRHGLHVVDDRESIPPDADHFTDCMHLADRGAEAMAERFYRYFEAHDILEWLTKRQQTSASRASSPIG